MKKTLSLILALALVVVFATFFAEAKILHQCHCCGGDGKYTCDAKDCKDGKIPCGGCNATGQTKEKCAECNGTGQCRVCQGTGTRPGDSTVTCDHCKGNGQCPGGPGRGACTQGYYYKRCTDCNGEGTVWHNSQWCTYARNHGGQCPICKGTGYEGDGVEGTPNDGVSNAPRAGDGIYYLNGTYAIYGGASPVAPTPATPTPAEQGQNDAPAQNEPASPVPVPQNRNEDYDIPLPEGTAAEKVSSSVRVQIGAMTEEEQRLYAGMAEEELARLLENVQKIVSTAQPGKADAKTEELLQALVSRNGFSSLEEASLLPIEFDGHADLGFPVQVTVRLEEGVLAGGHDLYVYHLTTDGTIELLEKADYTTYETGSVETISFHTTGFSSFFTAGKELDLAQGDDSSEDLATTGISAPENSGVSYLPLLIATGVVVLCAVTAILIYTKKKKK